MQALLQPLFQPIVDDKGAVYAYEALLRFKGQGAATSPAPFVNRWERSGYIKHADRAMLRRITEIVQAYQPPLRLAVNVSIATVEQAQAEYLEALAALRPFCRRLIVELTETAPITDLRAVLEFIVACRKLDCSIGLDDCRAGHPYGDPEFIGRVRPHCIKLDGEFLHECFETRQVGAAIAAIAAAKAIGAVVIAECVDSPELRAFAFWLGANLVQGYEIGKPAPLPNTAPAMLDA